MASWVRGVARMMMPNWVAQGYSARALQRYLQRGYGEAYNWQTLLGDFRQFTGLMKYEPLIRTVGRTELVPRGYMIETPFKKDRRYKAVLNANFVDPITGEESDRVISLWDQELRTEEAWEEEYRKLLRRPEYEGAPELKNVELRSLEHHTGWDY